MSNSSSRSQVGKKAETSKQVNKGTRPQKKVSKKSASPRNKANSAKPTLASSGAPNSTSHLYSSSIQIAKPKFAMELGGVAEIGQYLVRTKYASAAQALSLSSVEFNAESRSRQVKRLREFRADTQLRAFQDMNQCISDLFSGRPRHESAGLISNGVVVSMTYEEAQKLCKEIRDVQLLRNQALTLISPTLGPPILPQIPPAAAWHLEAIGQESARKDGKAFTGAGVRVAVMDTGIDISHPALQGRIIETWKINPNVLTNDFQSLEKDDAHFDTDGHGTHVAGILIGVAPDVEVVSITMMPKKIATTFDFIKCLDWAAIHPEVSLINLSAGVTPFDADMMPYVADVITTGALPIVAVGNEGANNTRSPGNYIDGASVGSVDPLGKKVSAFSGSGKQVWNQLQYEVPDLVAPGREIWSSYLGNQYVAMDGTSMAAPIVSGIAACLIEQAKGLLSPLDLMDQLRRSCLHLEAEPDTRQGAGLIQVPRKP